MDWTVIIIILVLAFCMLGCCGGSIFRKRNKNKDHDDTHKGCH